jgi:hypothetical protein
MSLFYIHVFTQNYVCLRSRVHKFNHLRNLRVVTVIPHLALHKRFNPASPLVKWRLSLHALGVAVIRIRLP